MKILFNLLILIPVFCIWVFLLSATLQPAEKGIITNSITPHLDKMKNGPELVHWKYSSIQLSEIQNGLSKSSDSLRVVSFNVLSDGSDSNYSAEYQSDLRMSRVAAAIQEMNCDVIAVQEAFKKQIDQLLGLLGDTYQFSAYKDVSNEEINGVFYRRDRFEVILTEDFGILLPEEIFYPDEIMSHKVTKTILKDLKTDQIFAIFNTHLEFMSADIRERQAKEILAKVTETSKEMGVILCGDLNTFPNRIDVSVPGHDGGRILHILKKTGILQDTWEKSLLGHVGPIATFTNDPTLPQATPFKGEGTPGVILDHILVTDDITVLTHGVNSLKVDGCYPSDHMPVVVDLILAPNLRP